MSTRVRCLSTEKPIGRYHGKRVVYIECEPPGCDSLYYEIDDPERAIFNSLFSGKILKYLEKNKATLRPTKTPSVEWTARYSTENHLRHYFFDSIEEFSPADREWILEICAASDGTQVCIDQNRLSESQLARLDHICHETARAAKVSQPDLSKVVAQTTEEPGCISPPPGMENAQRASPPAGEKQEHALTGLQNVKNRHAAHSPANVTLKPHLPKKTSLDSEKLALRLPGIFDHSDASAPLINEVKKALYTPLPDKRLSGRSPVLRFPSLCNSITPTERLKMLRMGADTNFLNRMNALLRCDRNILHSTSQTQNEQILKGYMEHCARTNRIPHSGAPPYLLQWSQDHFGFPKAMFTAATPPPQKPRNKNARGTPGSPLRECYTISEPCLPRTCLTKRNRVDAAGCDSSRMRQNVLSKEANQRIRC